MIPPLSTSTVDSNPLFAKLWKHVTATLLDADASRKSENEARARPFPASEGNSTLETDSHDVAGEGGLKSNIKKTTIEQQLHELRIGRMKLEILRSTLQDLAYHMEVKSESQSQTRIPRASRQCPATLEEKNINDPMSDHPPSPGSAKAVDQDQQISSDLRDLLTLITAYLSLSSDEPNAMDQLTLEDHELLADEITRFKVDITSISSAVGTRLLEIEGPLTSLASLAAVKSYSLASTKQPMYNQDSDHTAPLSLITTLTPQTTHLSQLRGSALPNSLATLTKNLHTVLRSQAQQLQSSLLQLESSKHGVRSRHAQSRTTFLATVAAAMELKAQVLVLEKQIVLDTSGQETREWVRTKLNVLTDKETELEDRILELRAIVAEYEAADPELRVMGTLGERYQQVEAEMERVKRDIERLEREEEFWGEGVSNVC